LAEKKRMKLFTIIFLFCTTSVLAQDKGIAHFSVWSPKQEANFKSGYKQHLQWHKANNDSWNWYGWYIISGPRAGNLSMLPLTTHGLISISRLIPQAMRLITAYIPSRLPTI
jgi:hypothetical protein